MKLSRKFEGGLKYIYLFYFIFFSSIQATAI